MKPRSRDEHLFDSGSKRILALDGGGIRGILTLQILREVEKTVRERSGDDSALLADYFDLIGGTSTGSIIAAALALGFSVDRIDALYRELGKSIFVKKWYRPGVVRPKFPAEPVREALEREFGDIRLGDEQIRTGLAIIAKRLDTGSPWVLHNNPRGRYFGSQPGSTAIPNSDYLLRDVVRASTAAPTFFEPEMITIADGVEGAFVDGGVSPHNNPSLQLLLLATLQGFALKWPMGQDRLFLVSVGTGSKEKRLEADEVMELHAAALALRSVMSIMDDCGSLIELLLQWMSKSPTSRKIDGEVGDLKGEALGGGPPLLSYARYDVDLSGQSLQELGLDFPEEMLQSIAQMDRAENLDALAEVGRAAGEKLVDRSHFPAAFDLKT